MSAKLPVQGPAASAGIPAHPTSRVAAEPVARAFHAFQPDAVETELRPVPVRARWTLYLLAFFVVAALAWACLAKVDRVVTAPGKISSIQENLVLQPMETSVIKEIHVSLGQRVEAGQLLVTLDPTFAEAGLEEQAKRYQSLRAAVWRLECETAGDKPVPLGIPPEEVAAQQSLMARRKEEYVSKASSLDQSVKELQAKLHTNAGAAEQSRKQIHIAQDMENMYKDVFEKGASSRLEFMRAQSARIEAESLLLKLGNEARELDQALAKAKAEREGFTTTWRSTAMKELVDTRRDVDQAGERARKAARLKELVTLTAPSAGVVLELAHKSVGSVVDEAEPLVTLVPLDAILEAEAEVPASDIGHIREDDPVRIKLDAFPYQRHGVLEGRVRTISPDAFEKNSSGGAAGGGRFHRFRRLPPALPHPGGRGQDRFERRAQGFPADTGHGPVRRDKSRRPAGDHLPALSNNPVLRRDHARTLSTLAETNQTRNAMIDEKYVDGVLSAGLNRGMLRIDFYSVSPGVTPGAAEEKLPRQRLVMTPAGFTEVYAMFTGIMQKLEQAGLAAAPGQRPGTPSESAKTSEPAGPSEGFSPNF